MGSLFLRGKTWWMKYHINGRPIRKSTGEKVKMKAREVLRRVEGEVSEGKRPYNDFSKIKYSQLEELIITDYIRNDQYFGRLRTSLNHLKFFENYYVTSISSMLISQYIGQRIEEGASNASINRELSALKRMFRLGKEQTPALVDKIPVIKRLKENNIRKGFFEHNEFVLIRDNLPEFLYGVITFGYYYGWRSDEIRNLRWSSVDRKDWIVRLEVGESKNDEGRIVYLNEELQQVFQRLWEDRKRKGVIIPYVFSNHNNTDKIKCFRGSWDAAFKKVGLEKKLFHDLRRTAVRNMVRAGIPERVAMQISGHKTRSVFDRYNIVNDNDLKHAQQSLDNFMGTNLGTIDVLGIKKPLRN